jgi:hypothetical protein
MAKLYSSGAMIILGRSGIALLLSVKFVIREEG